MARRRTRRRGRLDQCRVRVMVRSWYGFEFIPAAMIQPELLSDVAQPDWERPDETTSENTESNGSNGTTNIRVARR